MVVLLADASNLKRNLLFCSQIIDLKIPVVIALTMMDLSRKKGIDIDLEELERKLGVPVVAVNPRKNKGIPQLKKVIAQTAQQLYQTPVRDFIENKTLATGAVNDLKQLFPRVSDYTAIHYLINHEHFNFDPTIHNRITQIDSFHIVLIIPRYRPKRSCSGIAVSNRSCSIPFRNLILYKKPCSQKN